MRHAHTGGTERYLNHLAAFLAEHGHRVTIVCRSHEETPHADVRFLVFQDFAIGPAWRMWAFARAVERRVTHADYDLIFGLGKTWSHDVVRLGGGSHQAYLELALSASPPGVKAAIGRHRLKHKVALLIEERALRPGSFGKVIVNSEMIGRDAMRRHGVPEDAIEVIFNGVELERFHPGHRQAAGAELRRSLGLTDEHRVVLYLGTGYARKGLDVLIDAFPALLRERPAARLVVVGYDSAQAAYEARARRLGISEQTRFLGGRRDPEVCYGAADLYVLPTRYDPFANSTLEALACGLPVITTATNGASELMDPGVQGTVLSACDPEPLARELVTWTAGERLSTGSHEARALAEQHGIESKLDATERILIEVAEGARV